MAVTKKSVLTQKNFRKNLAYCASKNHIILFSEHNITVIFKNAEILAFSIDLPLLCHTHAIGMPKLSQF